LAKTDLVDDVAAATQLREGRAGVEAVLRAVYRAGTISLADAARAARLPLPLATAVRRELEKAGVFERRQGLSLTRDGRAFVEEALGFAGILDVTCPTCGGGGVVLAGGAADALSVLVRHLEQAPATDVTLDQAPCTAETALRRAALMYRAGALEGRRILILGDDDSVSLALALFARHVAGGALANRIVVVELDPGRADFLEAVAAAEALAIEVVRRDLRDAFPADLPGAFDVVETDPPYTLEGATLFLTRAVEALAGGRGDVFFSFAHWPPGRMLDLQRLFLDIGLAVRAVHPAFNAYGGAAVLGSSGQLIELVGTGVRVREGRWGGPLYTAEVNPRERSYRCTRCNREWLLGSRGLPATIEELKARGCPACGNHAFARARKAR
jgi:predicted methyltransferase/DNA-directed RNA polymerase subunit RPC12/RpoP